MVEPLTPHATVKYGVFALHAG